MKKRIRAVAIIFLNGGLVLIHRKNLKYRKPNEYYVLPGVTCQQKENFRELLQSEILKELGLKVIPKELTFRLDNKQTIEYFYLCEYLSGRFGDLDLIKKSQKDVYSYSAKSLPEIVRKDEIHNLYLLPEGIKEKLLKEVSWDKK